VTARLDGKTCVITGATSGIGRASALALADAGADLVLVARSKEKAEAVAAEIAVPIPGASVDIVVADLERQAEIRRAAETILERHPRIDLLLNNAGTIELKRHVTVDGYERTFAVNHLAYFLLTHLLMPALREAPSARIVNVASDAHRLSDLRFDDLQSEKKFSAFVVYGRSKLANVLFTRELARRLEGSPVTVNAVHPGGVASGLGANHGRLSKLVLPIVHRFMKSPESGAKTSIYLCTSPDVEGASGGYYANCRLRKPSAAACNDESARRLWALSAEMVGVEPDAL